MEKVRSAMRHAEAMGAISIVGRDLWSYNASAVTIPGDDEAYTRGVKEALGRFVCLPEPRTAEAVEAVLPGWPGRSSEA